MGFGLLFDLHQRVTTCCIVVGSGLCWLVLGSVVFCFVQSGLGEVAGGAPGGWWIVVGINGWRLTGSSWAWLFLLLNFLFLFE